MNSNQILVVDDEIGIRDLLSEILWDEGYQVVLAENAAQARDFRNRARPDLVLLDIWMPDIDGISLLREWADSGQLTMPVIMMSGHGTIDSAVEATRIGASDFLEKPIALQKLLSTVGKALQQGKTTSISPLSLSNLGRSEVMLQLIKRLEHAIKQTSPVLLTGEPGCAIELCARFIHRANTPWVELSDLSELLDAREAILSRASEGSLFIKEIGELGKNEQKGLLKILGKLNERDIRLIATSTLQLAPLVAQAKFDSALLEAISGLTIQVPSLREHREDIPSLANLILARYVESRETPPRQFSTAALNAMRNHDWPGNLAQLKSVVKSLALTALGDEITLDETKQLLSQQEKPRDLFAGSLPLELPLKEARDLFEKIYFEYHLEKHNGSMSRIAEQVGLERTHLYRKLKQLGIKSSKNQV